MTIHDQLKQVLLSHRGKMLRTKEIHNIIKKEYPEINLKSVLPNDHAEGNKNCCFCAGTSEQLFTQFKHGKYVVR